MRASDTPAWIGAILLIGGIIVAFVVSPAIGAVTALIGGAILWVVRRSEAENDGDEEVHATVPAGPSGPGDGGAGG